MSNESDERRSFTSRTPVNDNPDQVEYRRGFVTRHQVTGWRFVMRRIASGIALHDTRMLVDPLRTQSRAVAIDMESVTLAAQGYRFRVPYGTLLCVSDKPLHGELKLPGQANHFYERAIREHIDIGIETMKILRGFGPKLHSRKLRAFDEPPFR